MSSLFYLSPIITVLIGAIFILLAGVLRKLPLKWAINYSTLILIIALIFEFMSWNDSYSVVPFGDILSNSIIFDTYSTFFDIIILIGSIVSLLISRDYFVNHSYFKVEFFAIFLFSIFGLLILNHSNEFIVALIALEIASISVYILISFNTLANGRVESMFKYLVFGSIMGGIYLLGVAFLFLQTGSTNLDIIGHFVLENPDTQLVYLGLTLISIMFLFKIAAFPFSNWVLDIYTGAPYPIAAFMAAIFKMSIFAFFIRISSKYLSIIGSFWDDMLSIIIVFTFIYGTFLAISQNSMKRMLAGSSIVHAGYALLAFAAMEADYYKASYAIMFYLVAYAIASLGAFGLAGYLSSKEGTGRIYYEDFNGLASERPYMAAMMSIFMMSLAGIPATIGFIAKFYIFNIAIEQGYIFLTILAMLATIVSIYYYLRIVVAMYFHKSNNTMYRPPLRRISPLTIGVLAIVTIVAGVGNSIILFIPFPDIDSLLAVAEHAIGSLFLK